MGEKQEEWENRMEAFWQRLQETVTRDNGIRAAWKRNAGLRLCDADGRAVEAFYRMYGGGLVSEREENRCFFAVCVSCLWKPEDWKLWMSEDWNRGTSLAEGARKFLDPESRETFAKRLRALLDLPWDEDGYLAGKLCRLLKFCKAKGMVVNGKALLRDLRQWNEDDRRIQRKWAREFYRMEREDEKGGKENAD